MKLSGALADYQVDTLASTTYIMLESCGTPYWRDDNIFLAYEAYSSVVKNKLGATSAHIILRIKTDLVYDLWCRLVPSYAVSWLRQVKGGPLANPNIFVRAVCFLLRRGLQPINNPVDTGHETTILLTDAELEMVNNGWQRNTDLHSKLSAALIDKYSDGAITVFEEGYGPLEEKGERWVAYKDACLLVSCGAPFADLVAECSGQSPDVVRDVINGIQTAIVETARMGASLGLSSLVVDLPLIGQIQISTFFGVKGLTHKADVNFNPATHLRSAVISAINELQPYPTEFGAWARVTRFNRYRRYKKDGDIKKDRCEEGDSGQETYSQETAGTGVDTGTGATIGTRTTVVYVSGGGGVEGSTEEDECASGEEVYSDGYDPWDEAGGGNEESDG